MCRSLSVLTGLLLALGLLNLPASAATLNVPAQYSTIQAAINASANGDTVLIADGTYTGPGNVDLDFGGRNITVSSVNGAAKTIIDCGGSSSVYHRGFYLHSGETNAVISGLTIQNGNEGIDSTATAYGGGIEISGAGVTIQSCILKNNTASYGGGISNSGGASPVTVTNCVLTGNLASEGGGLNNVNVNGGTTTVTNCTFSGNQVYGGGGAVYSYTASGASLALVNSVFYGDTILANSSGGAKVSEILTYSGTTVSYCDVQGGFAGTNNINTEPLFFSSVDFHLKTGSPCLSAGSAANAPSATIDGRPRPNPPSIGAYEAVTTAASTTALTSSLNPANAGQSVSFTAAVSGASGPPSGSVTFSIDGVAQTPIALANKVAIVMTSFAASGSHTITAAYSGDGSYASSSAPPLVETVNPHISPQYVSLTGSDSNPGTLAAPKLTIQAAINTALTGDTIVVEDGTYTGPGDVDLDFGGKNLTVASQHGAASTIIDCGGSGSANHRGFYLHSGETGAMISGLTIENGYEGGSGGGGGIYNSSSGLLVQNCILKNNTVAYGSGGGIYNTGGDKNGNPNSSVAAIVNCVFTGNSAAYSGSGIYNYIYPAGTISIIDSTFTGNIVPGTIGSPNGPVGGSIYSSLVAYPPGASTVSITNDIVYGDTGGEIAAYSYPNGTMGITATYCDIQGGYAGTGNINADPLFVSSPTDLHLQAGSPCLGMGTDSNTPTTTLDGQTRPDPPSMGAYELLPAVLPSLINDTNSGLNYGGAGWFYSPGRSFGDVKADVHATQSNGDSVSFSFLGSSISVLSETNVDEGTIDISIDGVYQKTINCSAASRQVQQTVYTTSGLAQGMHTLKMTKTGGTYMLLDALLATPAPASSSTVNDTDFGIAYTGSSWGYYPNRGVGDFQDDVHAATTNGDSFTYTFTGTGVSYGAETDYDEGNVQIFLDGALKTTVNCYSPFRSVQQALWSTTGLASTSHTLKIVKQDGQYMLIDALQVSPAAAARPITVVNDTGNGITYTGSGWIYSSGRSFGDVSSDVHATTVDGSSVSYVFTGGAISWLTETNADEGNVQVYLDGVLQATVNCATASRQVQQAMYSASGLSVTSTHTLKLVKMSGNYLVVDAFRSQ